MRGLSGVNNSQALPEHSRPFFVLLLLLTLWPSVRASSSFLRFFFCFACVFARLVDKIKPGLLLLSASVVVYILSSLCEKQRQQQQCLSFQFTRVENHNKAAASLHFAASISRLARPPPAAPVKTSQRQLALSHSSGRPQQADALAALRMRPSELLAESSLRGLPFGAARSSSRGGDGSRSDAP